MFGGYVVLAPIPNQHGPFSLLKRSPAFLLSSSCFPLSFRVPLARCGQLSYHKAYKPFTLLLLSADQPQFELTGHHRHTQAF